MDKKRKRFKCGFFAALLLLTAAAGFRALRCVVLYCSGKMFTAVPLVYHLVFIAAPWLLAILCLAVLYRWILKAFFNTDAPGQKRAP